MSRRVGARGAAVVAGAVVFTLAGGAGADTWSDIGNPSAPGSAAERAMNARTTRDGLVVGLGLGYGVGHMAGYPNSVSKIGDPNFYSSSNLLSGGSSTLMVMGALADYVNVGFWFGASNLRSGDWTSSAAAGGLRVELFPLFGVVPRLRDLGVFGQFGAGTATLHARAGNYPDAKGAQSFAGAGAFYEWRIFRAIGGHGVIGPSLEYDGIWSQSIARSSGTLGVRFAFYGGM